MRNWLFWITAAVMLLVTVTTWGSIGSGLTLIGLVMLVGSNISRYCQDRYAEWDLSDEEEGT